MRALAILVTVCGALAFSLTLLPRPAPAPAPEFVRVVDHLRTRDEPVAGLSLAYGADAPPLVFARARGQWRCLSVWNAPADGARIEELLAGLLASRGAVRAEATADHWGLDGTEVLELRLHGRKLLDDPEGDVLLSARFGQASRVGGVARAHGVGSFARLGDDPRVLELDFDPLPRIGGMSALGLPPLLALRVAPPSFPGAGGPIVRVFLERAEGTLELVRSTRVPLPPAEGVDPNLSLDFAWDLVGPDGPSAIPPLRGEAYSTWAPRAPYELLADPRETEAHGVGTPELRLTLVPASGDPLVLEISAADALGRRWVRCPSSPQLARVDAATAAMLTPDAAELSDSTRDNDWDAWLRAELARR